MIKAANESTILLGLSELNVQRLKAGDPIMFKGEEIGIPGKQVIIVYGMTEMTIMNDLQTAGLIGPNTEMRGGEHAKG